jgi:hypothetical protein
MCTIHMFSYGYLVSSSPQSTVITLKAIPLRLNSGF